MEKDSDTEEYGTKKKVRKVTTAADLFKQIQAAKPGPSRMSPPPIQGVEVEKADSLLSEPESETQIDVGCDSSSLLKPKTCQQSSGTGRAPPLNRSSVNDTFNQTPDLRQLLLSLHEKVDTNARNIEESKLAGYRSVTLLSQINAKLDVLASQLNMKFEAIASRKSQQIEPERIETMSAPLNPIKSLEELESLERKTNNEQFVAAVIQYVGTIHGRDRFVGEGGTVCLQIVDYFFQREFLLKCSWTGTSRKKNSDENTMSKIPFQKFDGVITLFHKAVMFSDPSFPLIECQKFLKRCLRNAKQRFGEIKGIRAPVARKRRKRSDNQSTLCGMDDDEEKQDEEEESLVEYDGPDEMDISDNKGFLVEEYLLE